MSDPNSTSSDILSDGPVKDILRHGFIYCLGKYSLLFILANHTAYWKIIFLCFVHRRRKIDKLGGGGGGHIHMFVFTDLKNNRFQNKLIMQNTNI
jgi:hypothetical protein